MPNKLQTLFLGGLFGLLQSLPTLIHAEQSRQFDQYVVHYNAIQTSFLTPKVASDYDIKRSSNRMLLNISVLKQENGASKATAAAVWVSANSLGGQQREISMRPIHEGEAIYYIGELTVNHRETLNFNINVQPVGENKTYTLKYSKEFFVD